MRQSCLKLFSLMVLASTPALALDKGDAGKLVTSYVCSGCDLRGAHFLGVNLIGANLSGADLTNANLEGAYFCRTVMPSGEENNSGC